MAWESTIAEYVINLRSPVNKNEHENKKKIYRNHVFSLAI